MTIAVDMEIRISLLQAVQAVFFFSLLIAVSAWDLRYRIIPDRFQAGIALLSFLNFAPRQLFGALGAVPYLIVALFCKREGGIGGGDIKLAGATGLVLGLPARASKQIVRSMEYIFRAKHSRRMITGIHWQVVSMMKECPFRRFGII